MSKILKAENRLKADKRNKFTFLYNAAQNNPTPVATLEDPKIKSLSSEKLTNQSPPAIAETDLKDNPGTDKKSQTQKNSINLLKISILLLAAALIAIYLNDSEWKNFYAHSNEVAFQELNEINRQMAELEYSVAAIHNELLTEISAGQKVHVGLSEGINEQGAKIYEVTQNLNKLTTEFSTAELDLTNLSDSFQKHSVKFKNQENKILGFKNELKTLTNEQLDLKVKIGKVTEALVVVK